MSGSSLDGLDICYTHLEETRGQWKFDIQAAACLPYTQQWAYDLKHTSQLDVSGFLKLHTGYGRYLGEQVSHFIQEHSIDHKVHFIASHGHTVFHDPAKLTTFQLGDGAAIAAATGLPVVSDLRSLDVALGGQGAPIVPIGDKLLFGEHDYWLNIGGIANITVRDHDNIVAFDVCPANQMLNALAEKEGKPMDEGGELARQGNVLSDVLEKLNEQDYYRKAAPKSLSNEAARQLAFPPLLESAHDTRNLLCTAVQHIAEQVADAVKQYPNGKTKSTMLVTGGGAFNSFLIEQLENLLKPLNVIPVVPDEAVVKFKEALVMALIGTLRWREEANTMSSVTGASRNSVGGALWMGQG